jgi:thiosulfate/3-mercaptopyruvate sulfurtransferase
LSIDFNKLIQKLWFSDFEGQNMPWLINAAQLDKFRKNQKNLVILDASYHLEGRDARQEFNDKHIIDAQFFDIDYFSDPAISIPHMLIQDEKSLSEKISSLGIRTDYKIIFYDNSDIHSACRALWMFKMFGHNPQQLYILDGGFKAWEHYNGKIESGIPTISAKPYLAKFQPNGIRSLLQIKQNLQHANEQIIDVRHPIRYAGGPEPRLHLRSGHIPGSVNFPYFAFFDKNDCLLPLEKIRSRLTDVAIDLKSPLVATCGSAITACILDFVLDLMEHNQHSVYDGSWSEWGNENLYPGEQSLDERPIKTCLDES